VNRFLSIALPLVLLTALGAEIALPSMATADSLPTIVRIRFKGNRQVEDAAIRGVLATKIGLPLSRTKLAADVRAIWAMNYFDDVQVNLLETAKGGVLVYIVREKPSIRKVIVGGHDEIELDKINEVLDLKRGEILDVAKVKRNLEKIRDLYVEKGFYLAEVNYRIRKINRTQIDVIYDVRENAKVLIRKINFVGNSKLTADELKRVMGTQEGGYFSFFTSSGTYQETAFQRDMLMLTYLYYDRGFINVKLSEPRITLSGDKKFMYISIHVREGKQFKFRNMDIKGDMLWKKKELMSLLQVRKGEIFSRTALHKDVLALTDKYKDRGYAYANVTPLTDVDSEKLTVDITLNIEKGEVVYFQRINIRGNTKTRDKVIRRELKIAEGDRYSQTLLNRSKARVTALGFFEAVDVSTRRGTADNRIVVNLEVKERPTGTFQVGAGFSSVESFIAQAQVSQNNLFGRGQRMTLQAQISGLRQLFSLSFWEPYFLDSRWTFAFDVYNRQGFFGSFTRGAVGGTLTWGYPITDDIRVFATYKAEHVSAKSSSSASLFGTTFGSPLPEGAQLANYFRGGFTSSVRLSIQWDTRNNRLFPSKGMYHMAWAEFASKYMGSQNQYNRFGGFSRFYYPIWGPIIFKFNAQIGVVTSPNPEGVPLFERFFAGGIMDIRGFKPRTLSPTLLYLRGLDPNETVQPFLKGGNKKLVFNAEIEFPIFEKVGIKGVIFSDAGNVFDDDESISFTGLRHSVGWGFRWFSPIGPLRFEWGVPLSPNPGEDPVVFEFTIGNFF
jgi:outer membrane protein insertion porin family